MGWVNVLNLFLFAISTVGTWEFVRVRSKIGIYYIPSLTIAWQVSILLSAGILNCLKEGAYLIYFLGIFYFAYSLIKKERRAEWIQNYCTPGFLFLLGMSVMFLISFQGRIFTYIDNYTHWAVVVKGMLLHDRFPNFTDVYIEFQGYPLASSVFIYYLSRFVGNGDPVQMFAQTYIMLACILPLCGLIKKYHFFSYTVLIAVTNFLLTFNNRTTELMVDTLLPIVAACAYLFLYEYCRNGEDDRNWWNAGIYLVFVTQIKNSGALFSVIGMVCLLLWNDIRKNYKGLLISIILPIAVFFIWHKHCTYVFQDVASTMHSVDATRLMTEFLSRTPDELHQIVYVFGEFLLTWDIGWKIWGILTSFTIIVCVLVPERRKRALRLFLCAVILWLLYNIGLLATYLFSMPTSEAVEVSSIVRYEKTVWIAISYLACAEMIDVLSLLPCGKKQIIMMATEFLFLLVLYYSTCQDIPKLAVRYKKESCYDLRQEIQEIIDTYGLTPGGSYAIIDHMNRPKRMVCYLLWPDKLTYIFWKNEDLIHNLDADAIIRYDENEFVTEWVAEHYPEQLENRVVFLR